MVQRAANGQGMPIFVNASAWLAFTNMRDQYFPIARSLIGRCIRDRARLVATTWTAYEALSMLKSRVNHQAAMNLWTLLSNTHIVILMPINGAREERALDLFFSYQDKTWGIVDCASLIVMEDLGCPYAIAFDHHFTEAARQRGFHLLT